MSIAKQYFDLVVGNPEIVRDASALNALQSHLANERGRDSQELPIRLRTRGSEDIVDTVGNFSVRTSSAYADFLHQARVLPVGEIDKDFFFEICYLFAASEDERDLHGYASLENGEILLEGNKDNTNGSSFALSFAYAHAVLTGLIPETVNAIFDYQLGDRELFPSERWSPLIREGKLTPEELLVIGERLYKLGDTLQEALYEGGSGSHLTKNTPLQGIQSLRLDIQEQLEASGDSERYRSFSKIGWRRDFEARRRKR